ncbi:hypothetical protein [Mesobacterium pallidum]|uniref:hypothetical protein n=1 Tax=Mesobacterium pallidum TaxID=2872037 RepID=UPI001EE20E7A|nr:hypothetical protein [Mesobacterium pallidum]
MLPRLRNRIAILAIFALAACDPLMAPYSVEAYRMATELKARSLALVGKSSESYAMHEETAEALLIDIDAAYEYARGLPRNEIAAEQWRILRDPKAQLMGGFVAQWQRNGTVGAFFRQDKAQQIGAAFDTIICLEINKRAATRCGKDTDGL